MCAFWFVADLEAAYGVRAGAALAIAAVARAVVRSFRCFCAGLGREGRFLRAPDTAVRLFRDG